MVILSIARQLTTVVLFISLSPSLPIFIYLSLSIFISLYLSHFISPFLRSLYFIFFFTFFYLSLSHSLSLFLFKTESLLIQLENIDGNVMGIISWNSPTVLPGQRQTYCLNPCRRYQSM